MSPILNVVAYRKAYGDLNMAFGDDWDAYVNHFLTYGASEMREMGVLFNPVVYADAYADIKAAYGSDLMAILRHYLTFVKAENRTIGTSNGYADMAAAREAEQADPSDTIKPNNPSVVWSYDGKRTEYEYDNHGNCISEIKYDAEGKKTESRHFEYNSNGDVVYLEDRDSAGDVYYQEESEYDRRKMINKKVYWYESLNMEERYEWNGSKVKILRYNDTGDLFQYDECETDSRLNITKKACYQYDMLYQSSEYTYDENNNVLTQTIYDASGNETDYYTYSYYENVSRKTESQTWGNRKYKYVREYNENGSEASRIDYEDGLPTNEQTYEYYAEGSLAKYVRTEKFSNGDTQYEETYYDSQGRTQKIIKRAKCPSIDREYETITEYAADGSYTISAEYRDLAGTLTRKSFQEYNSKDVMVKDIGYNYSNGSLKNVSVEEKDENGRALKALTYEADGVTIIGGTTHTYKDTEYGYVDTQKTLGAGGSEISTLILMYDKAGNELEDIMTLEYGSRVERWKKGEKWYYSAEDKLQRKEILWPNSSRIKAAYEYENGKEIKLVENAAGEWVRPSEGSNTDSGNGTDPRDNSDSGDGTAGN